jgi:hypothetical protein
MQLIIGGECCRATTCHGHRRLNLYDERSGVEVEVEGSALSFLPLVR